MDEKKLLDIIADKQASGWEYGTHPRDKAKIVLEAIRPHLAPVAREPDTFVGMLTGTVYVKEVPQPPQAKGAGDE